MWMNLHAGDELLDGGKFGYRLATAHIVQKDILVRKMEGIHVNLQPVTSPNLIEHEPNEIRTSSGGHFSNEFGRYASGLQLQVDQIKKAHEREIDLEDIGRALFHDGQISQGGMQHVHQIQNEVGFHF